MVRLDSAANPGNGVTGSGIVSYPVGAAVRNYPANWSVDVQNWILRTSCHVLIINAW